MSSEIGTVLYLLKIGDILYKSVGLCTIILSTIGNFSNCFIFVGISPLNKHPNALFIIGSSIGSLLFINIGLIPSILQIFTGINLSNQSLFWCKISSWLYYSSGCFSFMCNCYTALEQFLITLPKIKWQRLITRIKAKFIIFFTGIIWLLIFLPLPIYSNHIRTSTTTTVSCIITVPIINNYCTYWIIIGYYFLPIILILILFCLTWYNLRQLLKHRRNLEGLVTRMMLIQMSVLLISGIPTSICIIYILITQYYSKTLLRLTYETIIYLVFILFTLFTNGISFWIYLFVSKTFRKHLKNYISKCKLFQNRIKPTSMITRRTIPLR